MQALLHSRPRLPLQPLPHVRPVDRLPPECEGLDALVRDLLGRAGARLPHAHQLQPAHLHPCEQLLNVRLGLRHLGRWCALHRPDPGLLRGVPGRRADDVGRLKVPLVHDHLQYSAQRIDKLLRAGRSSVLPRASGHDLDQDGVISDEREDSPVLDEPAVCEQQHQVGEDHDKAG